MCRMLDIAPIAQMHKEETKKETETERGRDREIAIAVVWI